MISSLIRNTLSRHGLSILLAALVLYGLYLSQLYHFLLFHALVELSSVIVAFLIFVLVWHSRHLLDNGYLRVIGLASLFTGVLDLLHTLAYKGMGIFPNNSADLPTQLWIAFRYMAACSFLLAPVFLRRRSSDRTILAFYAAATAAVLWAIFSGRFPACFVEGQGLTDFKIISEYLIALMFLAAFGLLYYFRNSFDRSVFLLMSASTLAAVISEICFTQYVSVYGQANMIGHFFLLGSVAFVYRAIVVTGITDPSRVLFNDLRKSEEALKISEGKYRSLFDNMVDGFAYHEVVQDQAGKPVDYVFLEVNRAFERITGLKASDITGRRVREVLPGIENDPADWIGVYGRVALEAGEIRFEQYAQPLGKWFSVTAYSPRRGHFATVFEDITERKRTEREIEHLASFPRMNPNPVIELNAEGRVVFANKATESILAALQTGTGASIFVPGDLPVRLRTLGTGTGSEVLYREVIVKDRVFVENIFLSHDLQVARIYATDITERRQMEDALRQSEERLSLALASAELGTWDFDPATGALDWSRRCRAIFGLLPDSRVDYQAFLERVHPQDRDLVDHAVRQALNPEGGGRFEAEFRSRQPDGTIRWVISSGRAFFSSVDGDRRPTRFVGTILDVTERKAAEEKLRESEERFRTVFEQAAVGITYAGLDGRFIRFNRKLEEITGYSREELEKLTFRDITHPDDLEIDLSHVRRLLSGEVSSFTMDKRYLRKDGSHIWINLTASVIWDQEGKPGYFVGIIEDIEARKRAEEQVNLLNRKLKQNLDELTELNKELESFSYSVSHDLRAPLRHIAGFVDLLKKRTGDGLDEKSSHYLNVISGSAEQMGRMIDELLSFSRTGRVQISRTKVDTGRMVRQTIDGLRTEAAGRTIAWEVGELPLIDADPVLLKLVWTNLIANALKFTRPREQARIEIGAEARDGEHLFRVRDNGVGFDMKYRNKLFSIFQRLHRPEEFEGTGIGLANVQRIVHRHGGKVWAESEPDRGAAFYFSIPR